MHRVETAAPSPQNHSTIQYNPARSLRTHCPQGHAYSPDNTYVPPDGSRQCKKCRRDRAQIRRDRTAHKPRNSAKTHCPQGHEYTPENTALDAGTRKCIRCRRDHARMRHQQNPETARRQAAEWRKNNPDKARLTAAKWRQNNLEKHRLAAINWYKKWYKDCPEKSRIKSRTWYKNNKSKQLLSGQNWRKNNPEKARVIKLARRARECGAKGTCTYLEWKNRLEFHGERCRYCGIGGKMTADHMIPLSRGGTNWPANLVPACMTCNARKRDKTYLEFIRTL